MATLTAFEALKQLHKRGVTILLVEQNVNTTLHLVDRAYVLEQGKIVLEGTGRGAAREQPRPGSLPGDLSQPMTTATNLRTVPFARRFMTFTWAVIGFVVIVLIVFAFIQPSILVDTLVTGGMWALMAGGLALVFGVMNIPNFAHGEFFMIGSLVAFTVFVPIQDALLDEPGLRDPQGGRPVPRDDRRGARSGSSAACSSRCSCSGPCASGAASSG